MKILTPKTEADFDKYFTFRWRLLRQPWDQPKGSEQDKLEDSSFHRMLINNQGQVVAVGRIHFVSDTEAQIRYMAVDEAHRNKGLGQKILSELEMIAAQKKIKSILLHGRENAVGFYEKQGYKQLEKSHVLFNSIQHYKMIKQLKN